MINMPFDDERAKGKIAKGNYRPKAGRVIPKHTQIPAPSRPLLPPITPPLNVTTALSNDLLGRIYIGRRSGPRGRRQRDSLQVSPGTDRKNNVVRRMNGRKPSPFAWRGFLISASELPCVCLQAPPYVVFMSRGVLNATVMKCAFVRGGRPRTDARARCIAGSLSPDVPMDVVEWDAWDGTIRLVFGVRAAWAGGHLCLRRALALLLRRTARAPGPPCLCPLKPCRLRGGCR
jgi:hypothetical protein